MAQDQRGTTVRAFVACMESALLMKKRWERDAVTKQVPQVESTQETGVPSDISHLFSVQIHAGGPEQVEDGCFHQTKGHFVDLRGHFPNATAPSSSVLTPPLPMKRPLSSVVAPSEVALTESPSGLSEEIHLHKAQKLH